jgi:hypothetical protein
MSQSKKKPDFSGHVQPRAAAEENVEPKKKNTALLLGLAIFCLLIFTVTGPMTAVFRQMMAPSAGDVATLVLPSGEASITVDDYRQAQMLMDTQAYLFTGRRAKVEEEDVLAYATLRKLAEEMDVYVTDEDLQFQIRLMMQIRQIQDYRQLWRSHGYGTAVAFEASLRDLLKVNTVQSLLAAGAGVVTDADAVEQWEKDFEELKLDYVAFRAEDFAEAAAGLEPTEEELQTFYDEGLDFSQRAELENDEMLAFDALVVSADALLTDAVKAWAPQEEPSEDSLLGFWEMRRYELYMRSPEDPDYDDTNPIQPFEEVRDQVVEHYRLNAAALLLAAELGEKAQAGEEVDLAAFAAEKGVELVEVTEPVPAPELQDIPRIGNAGLRQLIFAEEGAWSGRAILVDDLAYVARPTTQVLRALPELAEVRDSVVDYWRESRQGDLAAEAAQAFQEALRPEGWTEGSPLTLDAEAFTAAAVAAGREVATLDWVARRVRPAADPKWDKDDRLSPWLRNQAGLALDDSFEGDVRGPLENSFASAHVVYRLAGKRAPDSAQIWPGEMEAARRAAQSQAVQAFRTGQLSYEGLAQAYEIEKVLPESVEG